MEFFNASVFFLAIPRCFVSDNVISDILCVLYLSVGFCFGRFVIPCDSHSFVFWMLSSVGCVIVFLSLRCLMFLVVLHCICVFFSLLSCVFLFRLV